MYEAVIFDFDFTLGDSAKGIELCINDALERLGYPPGETTAVRKTIGLSLRDTFTALTGSENGQEAGLFSRYFKEKADEVMVANTELYPSVGEILGRLKQCGCKLGIVTTKFHYRIEQILDKFDLKDTFDLIVGAEDVKAEKPDPEGLLLAAGRLSTALENVLYVGDSLVDAEAAGRAQVDFAGVLTGTTCAEDFKPFRSVYIAEDLCGIGRFLLEKQGD